MARGRNRSRDSAAAVVVSGDSSRLEVTILLILFSLLHHVAFICVVDRRSCRFFTSCQRLVRRPASLEPLLVQGARSASSELAQQVRFVQSCSLCVVQK